MAVALSPIGGAGAQFFDNNGNPLVGGKIYTYEAGTTTPLATYTTLAGTTAHTNPIILDSAGRVPGGEIWLTLPDLYKFVLKTSADVTIGTYDNIQGYSSGSIAYAATEVQTATAGQTLFVLTEMFYNPGTNTLAVFIDGVNQVVNNSYVESTSTSVTFMSGLHVGAVVKFVNLNVASTDATTVTYEPGFVGSVATTVAAKLQQTVSVMDFGAVADGTTDCLSAFTAAIATGKAVYVPDTGDNAFYISAPITSVQNMALFGNAEGQIDSTRTARIYAPEGFLINTTSPASRHIISLENIEVYGQGRAVAGKIGLSGQFGGALKGVYLRGFDTLMENNFAFLLDFVRCKFEDANIGLYLSTANETNVTNCFFGSSCAKPIDTYNLTPGTGGSKAALPFSVTATNFNFGTSAVPSVFSGQLRFVGNYGEAFSAPTASTALFEYVAMRFANATLYIADNHINGQGNVDRCWHIYSDNASGSTIQGLITRNWMRGYNDLPVLIGDKASFYNRVVGIEIVNNQVTSLPYVDYDSTQFAIPYEQVATLSYSGSLSVAGASFVEIPFTVDAGFIAQVVGNDVNIVTNGLYRLTTDVQLVYNATYRGCEARFEVNGVGTGNFVQTLPAVVIGGDNYNTMHLETLVYLSSGDDVSVSVRNGETVSKARLTVEKIPGANQYQGY